MPEEVLSGWYRHIKTEWKMAFTATVVIGLLAHMYKFANHLPNWDSLMEYYYPTHNMIHQGRHLQGIVAAMRGYLDAPWLVGILCLIYLGISVVLLVEIFDLHNILGIVCVSGFIVTSPTVTSGFAFMYMADAFAGSCILTVLGLYLTDKYRYGFLPGALLLAFAMGSYQAYLSVAMAVVLLWMVTRVLSSGEERLGAEFWRKVGHFALFGVLAVAVYAVTLKAAVAIQKIGVVNHQGIGSMHIPNGAELLRAVSASYVDTIYFFTGSLSDFGLYGFLNIVCLGILLVLFVILLTQKKIYRNPGKMFLLVGCAAAYPCASHIFYFATSEVQYHALMQFSLALVYLLLFWLYENTQTRSRGMRWMVALSGILTIYVFIVAANRGYRAQTLSYEKTYALMGRMVDRMEQLPDYPQANRIAVLGRLENTEGAVFGSSPALAGVTENYFVTHQAHIVAMLEEYFGVTLEGVDDEMLVSLTRLPEVAQMPCWPETGSVIQVMDVVVIKFSDGQ